MSSPLSDRTSYPLHSNHRWLLACLALATVGLGVIKLASEVAEGEVFALDKAILVGFRSARDTGIPIGPAWLKTAMIDFTALGSTAVLTLITLLAVGYLLAMRNAALATFIGASVAAGAGLNSVLKLALARPRPDLVPHLVEVSTASFPSGHEMNSATIYLTLAILLAQQMQSANARTYLLGCAIFLTLLVGFSRVYLGVHWPSDVLAGWAVGTVWACGSSLIHALWLERFGARRVLPSPLVT